jgi:hypothetical protein
MLIQEENLMEWTGYSRRADLMRWLRERRIRYELGRGGRVCVKETDMQDEKEEAFSFGQTSRSRA